MRSRDADVGDGAVDLEELEALAGELLAEHRGDLQRKPPLVFRREAHEPGEFGASQPPGGRSGERVRVGGLDDVVLVELAEVFFHGFAVRETERLGHVQTYEFRLPTLIVNPLLHHLLIADDSDARFERLERHAGKPLRVQLAQLILVIVVVWGAEDHPAQAALRDKGVFALRRFGGGAFGLVEGGEMILQHVLDGLVLGQPKRVVEGAGEQGLGDLAVGLPHDAEGDRVTFRLLEDQPSDVKQRVGPAGGLDLAGQGLDSSFVRDERHIDFGQGRRRFVAFARFLATWAGSVPVEISSVTVRPGLALAIPPRAAAGRPFIGSPFAPERPAAAPFVTAFRPCVAARILGVIFG